MGTARRPKKGRGNGKEGMDWAHAAREAHMVAHTVCSLPEEESWGSNKVTVVVVVARK